MPVSPPPGASGRAATEDSHEIHRWPPPDHGSFKGGIPWHGSDFDRFAYAINSPFVEPTAQVVQRGDLPVRQDGDAIVRTRVGEGSPIKLGTPGLILDVELPKGGSVSLSLPSDFNGFVYMLEAEASFGAN